MDKNLNNSTVALVLMIAGLIMFRVGEYLGETQTFTLIGFALILMGVVGLLGLAVKKVPVRKAKR